eukprot:10122410-Karenia_brevis.AAC.1
MYLKEGAETTQARMKHTKLLEHLQWQCASCKETMDAKEKYWTDFLPKNCKGDEWCQQYWDKIVAPGAERLCMICNGESEEKQF